MREYKCLGSKYNFFHIFIPFIVHRVDIHIMYGNAIKNGIKNLKH